MGLFSTDNAFGRFMDKVWKWIVLNFLCLICCIPIITIGPAITALYSISLKMARGEEVTVVKGYFQAFKQNFRKGVVIHIIMLVIAAVMVWNVYYFRQLQDEYEFYKYWKYAMYAIVVVYLMVLTYVYPLLAAYENSIKGTLQNALLLPIAHIGWTILILVITAGPLYLCYINADIMEWGLFFYLLCGFAVIAYIHSKIFVRIFAQYLQNREDEE